MNVIWCFTLILITLNKYIVRRDIINGINAEF